MADYNDRDLTCQDCGETFVFTADDQSYHAEKGFTNEPKRCAPCRQTRRGQRGGGGGGGGGRYGGERIQHPIVCSNCGQDSTVPFEPRGDRPVYCSDCFNKEKENA